ncbi:MAG: NAD-dependent epimerase/dehydratase family protein [Thermoplasmata archaeon]|nr:NAD-dependent epimerase/dehydratase family protein [Thermoplasmata archaeon]
MPRFDVARPAVVTGGAGAIGAVLVRALLARGLEVRVIDNFSSGRREHLPDPKVSHGLSVHRADIRHLGEFESVCRGAGSIWHLAANPDIRLGTEQPQLDLEHGTIGTSNVLEAARRADVPHVLFSSSSVVYGYPTRFPTPEDYGPLFPQSLYGASKLASEGLLSAYAGCFGTTATIFRFANIIGPTMTHGVIYDFFEKVRRTPDRLEVLGDGHQSKSYLRVEDCVAAMLVGAERGSAIVEAYNLGTVDRTSVKEIAERVVAATGGRARIEFTGGERGWAGDIPQQHLAIERITALGWKPQWGSTAAVERTVGELAHGSH